MVGTTKIMWIFKERKHGLYLHIEQEEIAFTPQHLNKGCDDGVIVGMGKAEVWPLAYITPPDYTADTLILSEKVPLLRRNNGPWPRYWPVAGEGLGYKSRKSNQRYRCDDQTVHLQPLTCQWNGSSNCTHPSLVGSFVMHPLIVYCEGNKCQAYCTNQEK
jgi:hypothetical protein